MALRLLKLVLLAAVGAALNLAVAWGGAATLDVGDGEVRELYARLGDGNHWEVYRWERWAGTRIMSRCWNGSAEGPFNAGEPETLLASWGAIKPPNSGRPNLVNSIDEAWGFPMRSMKCHLVSRPAGKGEVTVSAGIARIGEGPDRVALPLQPVWTGFAVDSAVYGLACFAAFAGLRDLARAVRGRPRGAVDPLAG